MLSFFLFVALIVFVFIFCQFDYYVSQCVPPCVYPAWGSLFFLNLAASFLFHVREIFRYYLFKYFLRSFLSSSGIPLMQIMVHLMLSQKSLRLSPFIFILFLYILFCSSDFHHPVFQVTYLFFCLRCTVIDSF